jgi:hypothetical protein
MIFQFLGGDLRSQIARHSVQLKTPMLLAFKFNRISCNHAPHIPEPASLLI